MTKPLEIKFMKKITSEEQLIHYIRSQLGEPVITVDVTDEQIANCIDDTIQKFAEFADFDKQEGTIVCQISGAKEYPMPEEITNIIKVSRGSTSDIMNFSANFGSGYVPDLWSQFYFTTSLTGDIIPSIIMISATQSTMDKYCDNEIYCKFNEFKHVLQVFEDYTGPAILHYNYSYTPNKSYDSIYNHQWVKAYATAKTKFIWGMNVGKYSQNLIGGGQINYGDIKSEAQSELETLDQQLIDRWSTPAPIDIA